MVEESMAFRVIKLNTVSEILGGKKQRADGDGEIVLKRK